jgi:hypothetical protein
VAIAWFQSAVPKTRIQGSIGASAPSFSDD